MAARNVVKEAGAGSARVITKIVVTYRLEEDAKEQERTFTLEHGGGGEAIDGIIWSTALVKKLAYREGDRYSDAKSGSGSGEWRVAAPEGDELNAVTDNCVWIHDDSCMWWEYCSTDE